MRVRVKICCIQSVEEARVATELGADVLGLVGEMPSGPGPIDEQTIAQIARATAPGVSSFLLTSRTKPEEIIAHIRACGTSAVQIVDAVPDATYRAIRDACPTTRIVQVIHVEDEAALIEAERVATFVDAVLLDSGRPSATIKELGGTGRTHDWSLSRAIVERLSIPVFLAGGLKPSNIADAITQVRPFGVDLCSGVRTDGALDPEKLRAFMAVVRDLP